MYCCLLWLFYGCLCGICRFFYHWIFSSRIKWKSWNVCRIIGSRISFHYLSRSDISYASKSILCHYLLFDALSSWTWFTSILRLRLLHFFMWMCVFSLKFALTDVPITSLVELFPRLRSKRSLAVVITCVVSFLISLPFTCPVRKKISMNFIRCSLINTWI